ncbi:MAG: hypothetical protein CVU79_04945 [Elusimicrobia bacterium HGW-Elusimicrobia-3]|nr:MAG: hypothetical protein CVU79_04945 [Elusimicrobia bacterium HGW-Elusimicrobia-3]
MRRATLKPLLAGLIAACCAAAAHAAPEMIVLASATYDSGAGDDKATAVAVDAAGNIFVTGNSGTDFLSVKYSKTLALTVGAASLYANGGSGNIPGGIAVDGLGNIIVAGMENGGANYVTLKYSANFGALLSSATYSGGIFDRANAVRTDDQNNIYVTGYSNNGTDDFHTIKYSPALNQVSSAAYDSGYMDQANALTFNGDYLIVAGLTKTGGTNDDVRLVRYDKNLSYLPPAVSFDSGGGDTAVGVAVDGDGNVIVAARMVPLSGIPDFLTLKYDSTLTTLISSAAYDSGGADNPKGVAVDAYGNITVSGFTNIAGAVDFFSIKYDPALNVLSTAAYDGGLADLLSAVAVDAEDNVIAAGESYTASNNYFVVKYNASPRVNEVSPLYIGETANVTFIGRGLLADTAVTFSDPLISTGAASYNSGQLTLPVTPAPAVILGFTTITVTNANGEYYTSAALARTRLRQTVPAGQAATINAMTGLGQVTVSVPAGSFSLQETITLSPEAAASGDIQQAGEGLFVAGNPSTTSLQNLTVTLRYSPADLGDYPETALSLGYYDTVAGWVTLPSTVNTAAKTVTAAAKAANNKYAVLKAVSSGGGIGGPGGGSGIPAKVYPNPYRPGTGGNFDASTLGAGIVFAGLAAGASFNLTIVDLAGQLIYQKSGTADSEGRYLWDTKSVSGAETATGVYIYYIKGGSGEPRKGKFAIIR